MRPLYQVLPWFIAATALSQVADNTLKIDRRAPTAFSAAPKHVIDWLRKQECSIPQAEVPDYHPTKTPHNLISGEFAAKGQKDWAALCSRNGTSSIKVLWGGKSRCAGELNEESDINYMQSGVGGKFVYSRLISVVRKQQILERQIAFDGKLPSALEHHGIDDIFVGKGSVTHYCHEGKWLTLQGAD
jgi:hypothetical protein